LDFQGYDAAIRSAISREWPDGPDWLWWKAQLYQESAFDRFAVSPVGASGLCQVMPATALDWMRNWFPKNVWGDVNPHDAAFCIIGGAKYMRQLQSFQTWRAWPMGDRHRMAQASYNAGAGWIIKAVNACGATSWATASPCLERFTGPANAKQTSDYVRLIAKWRERLP
jgi:soluble lytic murein transglycosylase-like protein